MHATHNLRHAMAFSVLRSCRLAMATRSVATFSLLPKKTYSTHAPMNPATAPARKKTTINTLRNMYMSGTPITMITAHDFPSGLVADHAKIDIVLVGDSLAMVGLGMEVGPPQQSQSVPHSIWAFS